MTNKPTPGQAPPEILIVFWCHTCQRIDFRNPKTHRDNGKHCPGLMRATRYVHAR